MPESRYSIGISGKNGLINESPGDISVVLDATVAEEWPPAAHILTVLDVDFCHDAFFFIVAGTVKKLALRTGNETAAPELDSACLLAWVWFITNTIDGYYRQAVGNCVAPHHSGPCFTLALLFILCIIIGIADGSRIDEDFCSLESHQTGCFGIPLIPANEHAEFAHGSLNRLEIEVARGEVELLIVGRIVWNVHLAVFAGDGSILLNHYCRIVVKSWCTSLEKGSNDDYAEVFGQLAVEIGGGARNRFSQVEIIHIFYLTEIKRIVQFLQYDEFCTAVGKVDNAFCQASLVVGNICRNM